MTIRQALTLAAFSAGFAVHAQAASLIDYGEWSDRELRGNASLSDWPPSTLMPLSRKTLDDQRTRYLPPYSYLDYDAKAFYAYIATPHLYLALMTSLSANTSHGLYDFRTEDHESWNWLGEHILGLGDFNPPPSTEAAMRIDHIGQLIYGAKPFAHMLDHKNNDRHTIEVSMPPIVFVDVDAHRPVYHSRDENLANPKAVTVPEPATMALLALGFLALTVMMLKNQKSSLPHPAAEPAAQQTKPRSRFSSARLLRRDVRNNVLLFKFLHQRKYIIL